MGESGLPRELKMAWPSSKVGEGEMNIELNHLWFKLGRRLVLGPPNLLLKGKEHLISCKDLLEDVSKTGEPEKKTTVFSSSPAPSTEMVNSDIYVFPSCSVRARFSVVSLKAPTG